MKKTVILITCLLFLTVFSGINLVKDSEAKNISRSSINFIWDDQNNILNVHNAESGFYYAGPNITGGAVNGSYYEYANLVFLKNWQTYSYVGSNMSLTNQLYPSVKEIETGDNLYGFTPGTYTIKWKPTGTIFLNFTVSEETEDDNVIAHWNFDEDSGNTIYDKSGNNNAQNSGCNHVNGISEKGLEIVDTDIAKNIPNSFDDSIEDKFSISCWINWYGQHPNTYSNKSYIFDCREDAWDGGGFILYLTEDGRIIFRLREVGEQQIVKSFSTIPPNTWNHIAVVFDHENEKLCLYLNGVEDNSSETYKGYTDTNYNAVIGNNHWAPGDHEWAPLNGVIDELRIYDTALTGSNIYSLYTEYKDDVNNTIHENSSANDGEENSGIPGFEMLLLLFTIAVFVYWKRKKY